MSKSFEIKYCPFCKTELSIFYDGKVRSYYCKKIKHIKPKSGLWEWFEDKTISIGPEIANIYSQVETPHYSMTFENGRFIQSVVIPPYWLQTDIGTTVTQVFKFPVEPYFNINENLIMEIPTLIPTEYSEEQLTKRIKNLIIFS